MSERPQRQNSTVCHAIRSGSRQCRNDLRSRSWPHRGAPLAKKRTSAALSLQMIEAEKNRDSSSALLKALLDSWDRNNTILVNLLGALPEGALEAAAMEGGPSIAKLFTHIHYVRLVFVSEDAPEFARELPEEEWMAERDPDRIAQMLNDSARVVRDAIKGRLEAGRGMDLHYDHPILLLQHMIWHEGYHHGQIKLVLKLAGRPITDEQAGPLTWDVWMRKR